MIKSNKIENGIFLLGFIPAYSVLFLMTSMYYLSIPSLIQKVVVAWLFILISLKLIIFDKLMLKEYLFCGISLVIGFISYIQSDNYILLIMIFCIIASKNIDSRVLIWIYMIIGISLLLYVAYSANIGSIEDLTYTRNGILRHSFGIIYPTDFAAHILYFCCGWAFLRNDSFGLIDTLFIILIGTWTFYETNGRFDAAMIILLAVLALFRNVISKRLGKCLWLVPVLSFLAILMGTIKYNLGSQLLGKVNSLLSGRLQIVNSIYYQDGVKWFGQKITENGFGGRGANLNTNIYTYSYIDSGYMRLLLIYGILAACIFLLLLIFLAFKPIDPMLAIVLIIVFLTGIVEQHFIEIAYNPFFIVILGNSMVYTNSDRFLKLKVKV